MKIQSLKIGSKLVAPADMKHIVPTWERHYQDFRGEPIQKWNDHSSGIELPGDTYGVDPTTIRAISLVKQPPTQDGEVRDTARAEDECNAFIFAGRVSVSISSEPLPFPKPVKAAVEYGSSALYVT